jgi:soluble lytic murein transglycosylase-like protein
MLLRSFAAAALTVAGVGYPAPASAELVTMTSGRTLSVRAVSADGEDLVLTLRGGGTLRCAASLIARIAPDEVPYPEPPGVTEALPSTPAVAAAATLTPAATPFDQLVLHAARRHNVDPRLVHAVITVESRYQPRARSPKGAMGLMQLMPGTARDLRVSDPYDPAANIEGGVRYLRQLLDRFDLRLAVAAYNAGAATVERFGGVPPYAETRDYVSRVLRLAGVS